MESNPVLNNSRKQTVSYALIYCLYRYIGSISIHRIESLRPPQYRFLANVNSRHLLLYVIARPSVRLSVCLSVCRLSVTFVHPTQAIEIFSNVCYKPVCIQYNTIQKLLPLAYYRVQY